MNNYELSIITVVKNDLPGLKKTINSINAQRQIKIEKVIVDGGSRDGSAEYALENTSIVVESKSDGGIYEGMQRGLSASSSNYVLFLNSGDELNGELYLSQAFNKIRLAGGIWGFGPIVELTQRGTLNLQVCTGSLSAESIITRKTFVPFPTVIATREALVLSNTFSLRYKIAEDFYTISKLATLGLPEKWDRALVIFSAGGVSYTKAPKAYLEELSIQISILGYSKLHRSAFRFLFKISRWVAGKLLDFAYSFLPSRFTHWRDMKSTAYIHPDEGVTKC